MLRLIMNHCHLYCTVLYADQTCIMRSYTSTGAKLKNITHASLLTHQRPLSSCRLLDKDSDTIIVINNRGLNIDAIVTIAAHRCLSRAAWLNYDCSTTHAKDTTVLE